MFSKPYRGLIRTSLPIHRLLAFAGLLAGLGATALAQSVPFPTYSLGENKDAKHGPDSPANLPAPWVVSNGQIITPVGTQVYLGIRTRAKAVALNPKGNHTAAVLQMGAPQAVTVFNTKTGAVLQNFGEYIEYNTFLTPTGSTHEPQWIDFYNDTLAYESGAEKQLYNFNTVAAHSPLPNLINNTVQNYPQFDLGIPGSVPLRCLARGVQKRCGIRLGAAA